MFMSLRRLSNDRLVRILRTSMAVHYGMVGVGIMIADKFVWYGGSGYELGGSPKSTRNCRRPANGCFILCEV